MNQKEIISPSLEPPVSSSPAQFKKTSLIFMIVLSFITYSFYCYYWLYNRAIQFDKLPAGDKKIGWEPVILLFLYILLLILNVRIKENEPIGPLDLLVTLLALTIYILYTLTVFKMRQMLNQHFGEKRLSGWLTFFFNIFYVQYHINRAIKQNEL